MNYYKKTYLLMDRKLRQHLVLLVLLSIFLSAVEVVGVSAIMPFIDMVINLETIQTNQNYQRLYIFFNFDNNVNFAISFGFLLFGFYIFKNHSKSS